VLRATEQARAVCHLPKLLCRRGPETLDDPAAERRRLVDDYRERFANPYRAAELGYVDEVIDPADTRRRLIQAMALLQTKRDSNPAKKHGNVPL